MRPRYPAKTAVPPPLPPEERPVGQLIAEAIKLYGERFWAVAALGLAPLLPDLLALALGGDNHIASARSLAVALAQAPTFSIAYVAASLMVTGARPPRTRIVQAYALAVLLYLPVVVLVLAYVVPALLWLAFVGLAIPAFLAESDLTPLQAVRRGTELARADLSHALGGICALVFVFLVARGALAALLHGQGGSAATAAGMIADVVLFPVVFVGSALLYVDQSARLRLRARPVAA